MDLDIEKIKEIGILEYLEQYKNKMDEETKKDNGEIYELITKIYEDEEIDRLLRRYEDLKKEIKSIEKNLKEIDNFVLQLMKENDIKKVQTDRYNISIVVQNRYDLDKQKLNDYLSSMGKSVEEFKQHKEVTYLRKREIKK